MGFSVKEKNSWQNKFCDPLRGVWQVKMAELVPLAAHLNREMKKKIVYLPPFYQESDYYNNFTFKKSYQLAHLLSCSFSTFICLFTGTEFILHCNTKSRNSRKTNLRAPSTEQKYAWKSLIEQRVFAIRGSVEYFSSTSDVSSSSASAIII